MVKSLILIQTITIIFLALKLMLKHLKILKYLISIGKSFDIDKIVLLFK